MAPRRPEQYEKIRAERKEDIIMAALEQFAKRGYHDASIAQIAKQAGVSKGLIYNYFDSKEDLLDSIFEHYIDAIFDVFGAFANEPPVEQLRQLIEYSFDVLKDERFHWRVFLSVMLQPEVSKRVNRISPKIIADKLQMMVKLFEAVGDPDPEQTAFSLGATLDGITLGYYMIGGIYPIEKMKDRILQDYYERYKR